MPTSVADPGEERSLIFGPEKGFLGGDRPPPSPPLSQGLDPALNLKSC